MSCNKKDKKKQAHRCPPPKKECLTDCEKMVLPRVKELTAIPTPILMINAGDGFSPQRLLFIEGEVSPVATDTFPVTAQFSIQVDGIPLDPTNDVVIADLDTGIANGETRSTVIRASVQVSAGTHTVELLGSAGGVGVELNPGEGGASLFVCEKSFE